MTVDDFMPLLGGKLDANNRWVRMSKIVPWDMVDELYAQSFNNARPDGRPPLSSRLAFGVLYIKESENLTQRSTLQHISENVYMQYFLGMTEFNPEPLFDSSMITQFALRFGKEGIAKINEEIYRRTHGSAEPPPGDGGDGGDDTPGDGGGNRGVMLLDATAASADIRYPTDLSLLNECREGTEKMIDDIWGQTERKGHKTPYSRKKARKAYLKIAKQRKPRKTQIRQAVLGQLECVEKNVAWLERTLPTVSPESYLEHLGRLGTIRGIAEQQRWHHDNPGKPVPDRIVSVRQPHVRPIVRGKAGCEVEFGQKLGLSIVDGYVFIDVQGWNNFAEGVTLQASAEKYRERHGVYPEAILADRTYRNRDNIRFCKQHGIRLSGPRLGRPKASEVEADRAQAYQDSCDRNEVEGRIGIGKRRYGLDLIYSRLEETGEVEAAMNILVMNVYHVLGVFLRFFSKRRFFVPILLFFRFFGRKPSWIFTAASPA